MQDPLGVGGLRLHEWVFPLATWRAWHGMEGGEVNASTAILDEATANVGATVMGRNMFGGHPGPWDPVAPWTGWWGDNPPYHHPVFVLTHHPRAPLVMEGGTTFTFVTDGLPSALAQARAAAGARDITVAGGANIARQCLAAGELDEMLLHVAPILLGAGERLFDGSFPVDAWRVTETVAAPGVTHYRFLRSRAL